MAAPAHTTRATPTGYKMPEGFKSVVAFANKNNINLWERDMKPPGIDGGNPIDTTTQHNKVWETYYPRILKKFDQFNFVGAYDPDVISDILAMVNVNQSMTFWFPDGTSIDFYGAMIKFEPGELKIGDFPLATVTICPTNWDSQNQLEVGPVLNPASGT